MKNLTFLASVLGCAGALCLPSPARAVDVNVTPSMQACSSDADCTIADGQCGNNCGSVPINAQFMAALEQQKTAICGQPSAQEPGCRTVPALTASCIHNRCTVGTAYREHADAKDYGVPAQQRHAAAGRGAIPQTIPPTTPPIAPQDIAPAAGDETPGRHKDIQSTHGFSDDRHGFTAYDLPDQGRGTMQKLGSIE